MAAAGGSAEPATARPRRPPTTALPRRTAPRRPPAAPAAPKPKPKPHGVTKTGDAIKKPPPPKAAAPRGAAAGKPAAPQRTQPKKAPKKPAVWQSGYTFVSWSSWMKLWLAKLTHNSEPVIVGKYRPKDGTETARALAATEAARAVAKFLHENGRGPEASFAADGRAQSPQRSANFSSRFRGVSADEREGVKPGGWKAQISVGSVDVPLGYFTGPTGEEDAARAYDKYVREHGLDRKTNFDD